MRDAPSRKSTNPNTQLLKGDRGGAVWRGPLPLAVSSTRIFAAIGAIAALAFGCGPAEDGLGETVKRAPAPREEAIAIRQSNLLPRLTRQLRLELGSAYGCVVAPSPQGSPLAVRVLDRPGAVRLATQIVRRLGASIVARVEVADEVEQEEARRVLRERFRNEAPRGADVEVEPLVGRTACPRTEIELNVQLSPKNTKRWAAEQVTTYGEKRVIVVERDPQLLGPDTD